MRVNRIIDPVCHQGRENSGIEIATGPSDEEHLH
jgi:hypothetical protein